MKRTCMLVLLLCTGVVPVALFSAGQGGEREKKEALKGAMDQHKEDEVRRLIKELGVDVVFDDGVPPLVYAAEKNDGDLVKILVDAGVDVNVQDKAKWTPLHAAAKAAGFNTAALAALLEAQGIRVDRADLLGATPLHVAAGYGNVKAVQLLIEKKANVDMQDKQDLTPLHYAAEWRYSTGKRNEAQRYASVVNALVQAGANVNQLARDYKTTPLAVAVAESHWEVVTELLKAPKIYIPLGKDGPFAWVVQIKKKDMIHAFMPLVKQRTTEAYQKEQLRALVLETCSVFLLNELLAFKIFDKADLEAIFNSLVPQGSRLSSFWSDGKTILLKGLLAYGVDVGNVYLSKSLGQHIGFLCDPKCDTLVGHVEQAVRMLQGDVILAGLTLETWRGLANSWSEQACVSLSKTDRLVLQQNLLFVQNMLSDGWTKA